MAQETKQANRSVQDIERNAVDEFHLENTTVQTLSWRGISVEKKGWATDARPTPILSDVDGYIETGIMICYLETRLALNRIRHTHRPHGTFWQRQDHSTQRARASKSRYQTRCDGLRECQWLYCLGHGFAEHKLLRRTGRCLDRVTNGPRNTRLRCTLVFAQVSVSEDL